MERFSLMGVLRCFIVLLQFEENGLLHRHCRISQGVFDPCCWKTTVKFEVDAGWK